MDGSDGASRADINRAKINEPTDGDLIAAHYRCDTGRKPLLRRPKWNLD